MSKEADFLVRRGADLRSRRAPGLNVAAVRKLNMLLKYKMVQAKGFGEFFLEYLSYFKLVHMIFGHSSDVCIRGR